MGLDTTHDCWHGAYSSFAMFRKNLAALIGMDLSSMEGFGGTKPFPSKQVEPLVILLNHSDCDGDIEVEDLDPLRERMQLILNDLTEEKFKAAAGPGYFSFEYFKEKMESWIEGLEFAKSKNEKVEFH